ncbi:L-threonylcarbamoyladenylate synthase [soil metagenome]
MAVIGKDISHAKSLLEKGELVAIPTETVYGLAANALDPTAVTKIFTVKDRPSFDPLIVHVASAKQVKNYVTGIPTQAKQLIDRFWPGPLTLLLPKKDIIPDIVTAGFDRVGIRCPDHVLTLSLLEQLSFPLAAPSANPFGYVSPTTPLHVQDQLGVKIPYILDGGPCKVGVESTIIGWENDQPIIYRLGGISLEQIEVSIGKVKVQSHSTSQPQAPGQLTSHYSPRKKFLLGNINELIKQYSKSRIGVLSFRGTSTEQAVEQQILSTSGNLEEATRNLFSMLRRFDTMDVEVVVAEEVPDVGLGRSINDRLRRAAAPSPTHRSRGEKA